MHLPAELCKMQRKKRETDGFSKNILMPRPVRIRLQGSEPGTVCQSFLGIKNAASYKTMRRCGKLVDSKGIEPSTSRMRTERSPS